MRRVLRATGAALLVAGGVLAGGTAQAAPAEGNGLLRLAHLSPDTPAVDVYVDAVADPESGITLEGVDYGTVSDYQDVPAGTYTVSMRAAGASPDTPPVLSTTVEVSGATAQTVAGVGLFANLGLEIIEDSLEMPPSGQARLRVLAAASNAETLDVALDDGTSVASGLAFASTSDYVDVPAGTTSLQVSAGGGAPTALPVDLAAGAVYSVLVLDDAERLTVEPVLDAAGPGVMPAGGVETGAGGTAGGGLPAGAAPRGPRRRRTGAGRRGTRPAHVNPPLPAHGRHAADVHGRHRARRRIGLVLHRLSPAASAAIAGALALVLSLPGAGTQVRDVPVAASATVPQDTVRQISLAEGEPRADAALPVRVRIPSIGVDSPLVQLGIDDEGVLVPPADFTRAGWFSGGPVPGDVGPSVIAGHVDSYAGPAVFFRLRDLVAGDEVLVDRADGTTARFTVTGADRYPKAEFPTEAVYGPTHRAELRLITCGGEFDRDLRSYLDNVVVTAVLA